jgi:hypothetical protein
MHTVDAGRIREGDGHGGHSHMPECLSLLSAQGTDPEGPPHCIPGCPDQKGLDRASAVPAYSVISPW